ncbi:hypothetical protein F5Y19DRAFT_281016 [Xylariaceae sp. FL1651]|nr:hypothetical protein F5Y19DRAFT_281016 [Xylariaceae sp. FL1651]
MRPTTLIILKLGLLLGLYIHAETSVASATTEEAPSALSDPQDCPHPPLVRAESDLNGEWMRCDSRYGLQPASSMGGLLCSMAVGDGEGKTISIAMNDKPKLLCDHTDGKVWMVPFLNKPQLPDQDTFTFSTIDVLNFTLQGALKCCDPRDGNVPCIGWGLLGTVPGRHDVVISINNDNRPEPVSCNAAGDC